MPTYEQITEALEEVHPTDISILNDHVEITIEWGDWKHDHLRADWLLEQKLHLVRYNERRTESDGGDCYSSIHFYKIAGPTA